MDSLGENSDGSYDWDIILYSGGFTINENTSAITGTGTVLYLVLNTNSATGIVSGTYTFSDERAEFTWVSAEAEINVNFESEEGEDFIFANTATIVITETDNNQVITATLVDENGDAVTLSYRGVLRLF